MSYTIKVYGLEKFKELLVQLNEKLSAIPFHIVRDLTVYTYRNVLFLIKWEGHYQRGTLYHSIEMDVQPTSDKSSGTGIVYSRRNVALWMEEGTKPHIIEPVRARALKFAPVAARSLTGGRLLFRAVSGGLMTGRELRKSPGEGSYVFAGRVHHPGTKPYRIFERGLEQAIEHESDLVQAEINKINQGAA